MEEGEFVEVAANFPEACRYVLETWGEVYKCEAEARAAKLPPQVRLRFHQQHSEPLMKTLQGWMQAQFAQHLVEPNSGLGKAITYFLRHWKGLTAFLRDAAAPLDNNICERALKRAVLHRKNALFYRTLHGSAVGDLFMSLIHTCEPNEANPFDSLTELQREATIAQGFWPATKTSENVSRRPLCPRFHFRPTHHPLADPRPARVRRPAGLDHCSASEGSRFRRCATATAGKVAGRCSPPRNRRRTGVATGPLGPVCNGSARDTSGLDHLGVGFVSLTEALDLTTPAGRAMAALLAVFAEFEREILRERVRAGLAHARQNGQRLGRPQTAALQTSPVRKLYRGR
jgi:transposase